MLAFSGFYLKKRDSSALRRRAAHSSSVQASKTDSKAASKTDSKADSKSKSASKTNAHHRTITATTTTKPTPIVNVPGHVKSRNKQNGVVLEVTDDTDADVD
ncbi:hypothetical protein BGZ79_002437, partial [Entomortierella chlamydospora]